MQIARSVAELMEWRRRLSPQKKLGFVPTMGALHEGHLSLVRRSKKESDVTVVSIFVNPLQFGPKEDFKKYPRPFEKDCELLAEEGVDLVFAPDSPEMYPSLASTVVMEESISQLLEGSFRPGHFRGVATVVLKLLNLVRPELAFFGQKDAQQLAVIERMVEDLNVPVSIVPCATVREADGLALSSRNQYLSTEEREAAPSIFKALTTMSKHYRSGERDASLLKEAGLLVLGSQPLLQVQYLEICDPKTFLPIETLDHREALVAVAAFLGNTRLIDNLRLTLSH